MDWLLRIHGLPIGTCASTWPSLPGPQLVLLPSLRLSGPERPAPLRLRIGMQSREGLYYLLVQSAQFCCTSCGRTGLYGTAAETCAGDIGLSFCVLFALWATLGLSFLFCVHAAWACIATTSRVSHNVPVMGALVLQAPKGRQNKRDSTFTYTRTLLLSS